MSDSRKFRDCLGRFTTGVTVITCQDAGGTPCGITANSFSSVSLDPPLVLWNIAKVSQSLDAYLAATYFGINVLSADQRSIAEHFALSRHDLYADIPHRPSTYGAPKLAETLAWFECRTWQIHDCGDHYVIIGEVIDFRTDNGHPLVFYSGAYRALT